MTFTFTQVKSPEGLIVITPYVFNDERGFFMETFRADQFEKVGIKEEFIQDNQSRSVKGVIRGLHFQVDPHEQSKLVRCIRGEVFDVAVDMRKKSDSFGKWFGVELTAENRRMIFVPQGFAHGIMTLTDDTEAFYLVNAFYAPEEERGLRYNDPQFGIEWPRQPTEVSPKDASWPDFDPVFHGIERLRGLT